VFFSEHSVEKVDHCRVGLLFYEHFQVGGRSV